VELGDLGSVCSGGNLQNISITPSCCFFFPINSSSSRRSNSLSAGSSPGIARAPILSG
jgi:hypothetical protein